MITSCYRALTGLLAVAALTLAGCTSQAGPPPDTPVTSSAPAPDSESAQPAATTTGDPSCIGGVDAPELPVWELSDSLPIKNFDGPATHSSQARAWEKSVGPCSKDLPEARPGECLIVEASLEPASELVLWRPLSQLTEALFSGGAFKYLAEDVRGATDSGVYRYHLNAWKYASAHSAAQSPVLKIFEDCGARVETRNGIDHLVLTHEGEWFTAAYRDGANVYLIESRDNGAEGLSDTASGILPTRAMVAISQWWTKHAFTEPPA